MKRPFLNSEVIRTGVYACLVALTTVLFATGCSGGGSGGGVGLPGDNDIGRLVIPEADDHGSNTLSATRINPGQEITSGFFNLKDGITGGPDIDYFELNLVANQWYGLQNWAHENGTYNLMIAANGDYFWQLLDNTGAVAFPNTSDWGWPDGVSFSSGSEISSGFRTMWQPTYTGKYYFTIRNQTENTVGSYAFKLTSSQVARQYPRGFAWNSLSGITIFDPDEGFLCYNGPAAGAVNINALEFFNFGSFFLSISVFVTSVTFFDIDGNLNPDPENGVWHFHWGYASTELNDGIDDAGFVNFGNRNLQDGDDHPFIFGGGVDDDVTVPGLDVIHMMIGLPWYMDVHITDMLAHYPFPIASSFQQAGVHMFNSAFIMNGFDTLSGGSFPLGTGTGSTRSLEIYYDDEFQVFYLPYGDVRDHVALAGSTLHVHADIDSANGPLLLDLGPIPPVVQRPIYEDFTSAIPLNGNELYTRDNVPGIENIIYKLSDAESKLLNDAAYGTGWYLDLHTSPDFINSPELRDNGQLSDNLEIGVQRAPN